MLSTAGGVVGLLAGMGLARVIHLFIPALPVRTPLGFVLLALGVSLVVGLASGILPAWRWERSRPRSAILLSL